MNNSETSSGVKKTLITGIPRSGTSLLTKLLSIQHQTICFSEPEWLKSIRFNGQSCADFSSKLNIKMNQLIESIKVGDQVQITVKRGTQELPDNYFDRNQSGYDNIKETKRTRFTYSNDLNLCVKSNTLFTACLTQLLKSQQFKIIAVVRNPVAVLMSWRSLDIPVSRGQVKIAELYSQEIRDLSEINDLLIKQVKIMDWFFKQYHLHKDVMVVKYEDIIAEQTSVVTKITELNTPNTLGLKSQNNNPHYDLGESEEIAEAILENSQYVKFFYDM